MRYLINSVTIRHRDSPKRSLNIYMSKSKWVYGVICARFRFARIYDNGCPESDFIGNFIPVTSRSELFIRHDEKVFGSRGSKPVVVENAATLSPSNILPAPIRPRKSYAENSTPGFRGNFRVPIVDHGASQWKSDQLLQMVQRRFQMCNMLIDIILLNYITTLYWFFLASLLFV